MSRWCSGIDLGTTHLRAVVLRWERGGWAWHRALSVPRYDEHGHRRETPEMLGLLRRHLQLRGPVRLIDSTINMLVRFVTHPAVSEDRLQRGMRMELIQHADQDGNLAADFSVLPIDGEDLTVCCCLAQPQDVDDLMRLGDRHRVGIDSIGPSMAGIADCYAALVAPHLEQDQTPAPVDRSDIDDDDDDDDDDADSDSDLDALPTEPEPERYTLLLDIGAAGCRVVLLRGRTFLACRSLPIGGRRFTEDLAEARGISLEQAERLKVSGETAPRLGERLGRLADADSRQAGSGPSDEQVAADDALFDGEDDLDLDLDVPVLEADDGVQADEADPAGQAESRARLSDAQRGLGAQIAGPGRETISLGDRELGPELRRSADGFYMQIASSLNWFRAQLHMPRLHIDQVVCSGGGARLVGLADYLQRRLAAPVRSIGPEELAGLGGTPPEQVHQFAVALGAAMPAGHRSMDFELRSQDRQRRDLLRGAVRLPYVATALFLAAAICVAVTLHLRHAATAATVETYEDHARNYERRHDELERLQASNAALQEDLRGIAGRIFSGRDLLNFLRALKQEAPDDLWITRLRTEGLTTSGEEVTSDTAIDRGSVHLDGRVKPETGDRSVRVIRLEDWAEDLAQWRPDPQSPRLFEGVAIDFETGALAGTSDSRDPLRTLLGEAVTNSQFAFSVRFDFQETQLSEVIEGRAPPAPEAD